MSPRGYWDSSPRTSFPRVSGDEPMIDASDSIVSEFSPRERG